MITVGPVTPTRTATILEGRAGGVPVLFNPADRRLHVLNETAAAVWSALERRHTLGLLADDLAAEFGAPSATVRTDLERMVEQFAADGLLGGSTPRLAPTRRPERPAGPVALQVAAIDSIIDVIVESETIAAAVADVLAPLATSGPADGWVYAGTDPSGMWRVMTSAGGDQRVGTEMGTALRLIGEINSVGVAGAADHLVLHAGAVARSGSSIVLPGSSNRGKSTLTTALVRSGLGYLTDEAAAIDSDRRCRPYAKAIALDPGSFSLFPDLEPTVASASDLEQQIRRREWHVDPACLGTVADAAPVRAVVCPHWRAGATTRLARLTPTEALHSLLSDAFDFATGGQAVFDILTALVSDVPVYRLGYGDLDDAVRVVTGLLD